MFLQVQVWHCSPGLLCASQVSLCSDDLIFLMKIKFSIPENLSVSICNCSQFKWVLSPSSNYTKLKLCFSSLVVSSSLQPHGVQPARLLCPWDSLGKNTGVDLYFKYILEKFSFYSPPAPMHTPAHYHTPHHHTGFGSFLWVVPFCSYPAFSKDSF